MKSETALAKQRPTNLSHAAKSMNIPRFINPHCSHEQQTITVSRATLFPQGPLFEVDDDKRTELDELLKANLGGFEVSQKRKKHIEGHSALHDALEAPRMSMHPSPYN